MAAIQGRKGELWAQTGTATAFTKEACTQVGATTTYKITSTSKRQWDTATAVLVYDTNVLVSSALYTLQMPIGRIVFASAPGGAVTVSGASWAVAEVGLVTNWKLDLKTEIYETTALGDTARSFLASGLVDWGGSFERFYDAGGGPWAGLSAANTTPFYMKLYEDQPSAWVWIGPVIFDGWNEAVDIADLIKEGISFSGVGDPYYLQSEA